MQLYTIKAKLKNKEYLLECNSELDHYENLEHKLYFTPKEDVNSGTVLFFTNDKEQVLNLVDFLNKNKEYTSCKVQDFEFIHYYTNFDSVEIVENSI